MKCRHNTNLRGDHPVKLGIAKKMFFRIVVLLVDLLKSVHLGTKKDKVKTSAAHLDHMFGPFFKTKTAIMAIALTKTMRKQRKAH